MKNLLSLALIGLAATAVACDQQSTVTDIEVEPSFSFENAPDFTGVVVRRDNIEQGLIWGDYSAGYIVYLGIDPRTNICVDDFYNDPHWDMQSVTAPSGLLHRQLVGEQVQTSVWPIADSWSTMGVVCDYILNNDPIGEGFSNFRQTWTDGHANNYQLHGRLTTPTGEGVNLIGRQHWVRRGKNGRIITGDIRMIFGG